MAVKLNEQTLEYAYFKGDYVKSVDAVVPIMSNTMQYGMGVFAGIRGYVFEGDYKIFRLEDHYKRMQNAIKILGLDTKFTYEEFKEIITELCNKNAPKGDFYIRPFVFSDTDQISPVIDKCKYSLAVYMLNMAEYFDKSGLNLCISSYRKYNDNALSTKAKVTGGYVNSLLAKNEAFLNGYDDAILLDDNGFVCEMSAGNIMVVYHGKVMVPFLGSATLEGITLRTAVELCKDAGYEVVETQMDRSILYSADEVLGLGTAVKVKRVTSVDKRPIGTVDGDGDVCKFLKGEFEKILSNNHAKSANWLVSLPKR